MDSVNSFWDFFLLMLWAFFLVLWIMIVINVLTDLFRDKETSGFAKVIWVIALVLIPFLTVLVYLIVRGRGMAERQMAQVKQNQEQMADYVRSVSGDTDPSAQIARAHDLMKSGAIDEAEFAALKAKALA